MSVAAITPKQAAALPTVDAKGYTFHIDDGGTAYWPSGNPVEAIYTFGVTGRPRTLWLRVGRKTDTATGERTGAWVVSSRFAYHSGPRRDAYAFLKAVVPDA